MVRVERFIAVLLFLSATVLFLSVASLGAQTRDPKLDALADEIARAMEKNRPEHVAKNQAISFLVFDFPEATGETTQLGVHLADDLSAALGSRSRKIKPVDRGNLRALVQQEHLDGAVFQKDKVALWGATTLGADLVVVGTIERASDAIHLKLRVVEPDPAKGFTFDNGTVDLTDERRAWQGQPVPQFAPAIPWKDVPSATDKGYSAPRCIDCPEPLYTEEARKAEFSGTATALLLIAEDGTVRDVRLARGLPCDLNFQILSAVKEWRYQPPRGPDGKSVTVQLSTNINFRPM
jgi:TonB family protein